MVDRILRMREVAAALSVTKQHVYALIRAGEFPKPISLGLRATGWRESDVNAWIANRHAPQKAAMPIGAGPKSTPDATARLVGSSNLVGCQDARVVLGKLPSSCTKY